ncbi:hypothetical protein Cni_G03086 [Canna indica]|uniref:Uncharacterized protein n=1 Tax=Canna indica TaxID=4628 RepID=A0AAQ3JQG0_9LILI|nr:hypothetical protein Cni_G03086 [Canna indica]
MAASTLLLASIAITLVFAGVWAEEEVIVAEPERPDLALKLELEQLRSKISSLETSIVDRTQDLKSKDASIAHLRKIIEEKAATILSLQHEIESLQKKGVVDEEELVKNSHAQASELEKQVEKLRHDINEQNNRRDALVAQASEAEKKVQELNLKLENLQKANDEQKRRIQKTQHALQAAEEELIKAQLEAKTKSKELLEVHGAWLPPWLFTHMDHFQGVAATHWKDHIKSALVNFVHKVSEKSVQAQKWVEPHLEMARTKWIPAMKEQLMILETNAKPYMQTVSIRTVEAYHEYKSVIATYVVKVQEMADPYFQVASEFSKPYIDQVVAITKPHVEKMKVAMRPYTKHAIHTYDKLLKSATVYHHQAQAGIHAHLKKYESTKPLATKEVVWVMASALLALPIFLAYRLLLDIFGSKKTTKPAQKGHANNTHRRPKRRHADK